MAAGEPSLHDHIAQGLEEHPAKQEMRFNLLVTAVEVGGSITLFHLAQQMGASDVVSYLIGSISPVLGGFMVWPKPTNSAEPPPRSSRSPRCPRSSR